LNCFYHLPLVITKVNLMEPCNTIFFTILIERLLNKKHEASILVHRKLYTRQTDGGLTQNRNIARQLQ